MRKPTNLTVAVLLATAGALPLTAHAGDYQWELGTSDAGFSVSDSELDFYGFYGTYYFRDVKTETLPLLEAAYLNRTGSVSLSPSRVATDDFGHFDQWRLSSEIYIPDYWLYFGAGISQSDSLEQSYNGTTIVSNRDHDTSWDATIGITPFAGLRLSTTYFQHADYQPNLAVKYVGKFGDDHYYGFGLNLVDPDNDDLVYSVSGEYFIDRTLKVGAELGENRWGVSADKFFGERFNLGLGYTEYDDDSGHSLGLRAAWRF